MKKQRRSRRWGKRKKQRRDWKAYNETLIRRGELLIPLDIAENWEKQLGEQNKNKIGTPFDYPNGFIETLGLWKCFGKLDYRTCDGIGRQLACLLSLPSSPQYSVICRRLRRLGEVFYMKRKKVKDGKPIYAVVDGTGLKVCNRGEWMRHKHKGKRKGFVRVVWAVDAKSGEITEFSATTEKVGDNKKFKPILRKLCKNRKVGKVGGDGSFDANENFDELKKKRIKPAIKLRANASTGPPVVKPEMEARLKEAEKFQRWGYKKWAEKRDYGKRWRAETAFSQFKNYFGEYVYSKGMSNIKSEVGLKVHYLNQLMGF